MALSGIVAQLRVKIGIDKREFDAGRASVEAQSKGLANSLNDVKGSSDLVTGALRQVGVLGMAYLAKEAAGLVVDLGRTGAEFQRLSSSFEELTKQAGGSADELLSAMKEATSGTVSEMELILAANKGMLLGLGADAEQWGQLMEVARFRARAMGVSMTQAVGDITVAIGREAKLIADNLGIIWDFDKIMGDYAATIGKTADELDSAERKQALMLDTIRIGQEQIAAAGGMTDDYADKMERMSAEVQNAKVALGEVLAPAIAEVAGGLAELIPDVVDASRNLAVLGGAIQEWARALLAGKDAQAAFVQAVAEGAGSPEEAARARLNAAEIELEAARKMQEAADTRVQEELDSPMMRIDTQFYEQALEAQAYANERVTAAVLEHNEAERELNGILDLTAQKEYDAALGADALEGSLTRLPPAAYATIDAVMALNAEMVESASAAYVLKAALDDLSDVSVEEIGQEFSAAAGRIESGLARLAGDESILKLRSLRNKYILELTELYNEAGTLTEFELQVREQLIMNAFDDEIATLEEARDQQAGVLTDMADNYKDLRGTVESALTATSVTAYDMELSAMGEYVDKWDENARRLDAIADRGFSELEAHPDWVDILKIPENVLAGGEESLKAWASGMADDVRNLFRPDLIDVEAAADAVEAYMQEQAARELTIDLVIDELVSRGGMTPEEAGREVRQAYGLETEPVDVPIQLVSAVEGDEGEGWVGAADELVAGIAEGMEGSSLVAEFVSYFRTDISENEGLLSGAGEALWNTVELGILLRLDQADYATLFVSKLGPLVGAWLLENQYSTQGGGEP